MDPYYATGAFYDALVKIDDWESGDINDVAQQVQRSGYPEAYRDHETDARVLASTLTGHSPAGFTCLDRIERARRPRRAGPLPAQDLRPGVRRRPSTATVLVNARTTRLAWAYAHYAVANAKYYGVTTVKVGDQTWQTEEINLPEWTSATPAAKAKRVEITLR